MLQTYQSMSFSWSTLKIHPDIFTSSCILLLESQIITGQFPSCKSRDPPQNPFWLATSSRSLETCLDSWSTLPSFWNYPGYTIILWDIFPELLTPNKGRKKTLITKTTQTISDYIQASKWNAWDICFWLGNFIGCVVPFWKECANLD